MFGIFVSVFSSFIHFSWYLVERNEGFHVLKGQETKLTLCISRNDSSEVDLLQQQGSLWSERITERAVHYFLQADIFVYFTLVRASEMFDYCLEIDDCKGFSTAIKFP